MKYSKLAVTMLFLSISIASSAQVATGSSQFGSFANNSTDTVNLGNLNVHIDIPIISKPGRGLPLNYTLSYDSSFWDPSSGTWQPSSQGATPTWGWRGITEAAVGYITYSSMAAQITCNGYLHNVTLYYLWTYHDPNGGSHLFPNFSDSACTSLGAYAVDNSGYYIWAPVGGGATVYSPSGNQIIAPMQTPNGNGTITDANGNYYSSMVSGNTSYVYDTLYDPTHGTNDPLTITVGSTQTTITYPGPNSSTETFTLTYTAYPIKTQFNCSQTAYTSAGSVNLLTQLKLPDGGIYTFTYEDTVGYSGYKTGRITSMTLPTGGTVSYSYLNSDGSQNSSYNPIVCSDGSTPGVKRVTPDSSTGWLYTRSLVSGTNGINYLD